jgi:hypothetical protein
MTAVRGKYTCVSKVQTPSHDGFNYEVKLRPVVGNSEENATFYAATPWGEINLGGLKESAGQAFIPGKDYYVDFTPAE